MIIYPETYGAVGDGIADDTIPVQTAIHQWVNSNDNVLHMYGRYRITSPLTTKISSNITEPKIIDGRGGALIDDFGTSIGALLAITVSGSGFLWRNLHIYDLNIVSGNVPNATSYLELDGGRGDIENGYEALYSFDIIGLTIQGPIQHGIQIIGNAFEGQITGGRIESTSAYGNGVYIASDVVSSIYLDKFTVYGFKNGIKSVAADIRSTNLTVLMCKEAGIFYDNNISGIIQNCHVENTWNKVGQSGAGIVMHNVCRSINNYGTANMGNQTHVLESWSTQNCNLVIGGFNQEITSKYALLKGNGTFELVAVPNYVADLNTKVNVFKTNKFLSFLKNKRQEINSVLF